MLKFVLILPLLISLAGSAQDSLQVRSTSDTSKLNAAVFLRSYDRNLVNKLDVRRLDSVTTIIDRFILNKESIPADTLAIMYVLKGNLRLRTALNKKKAGMSYTAEDIADIIYNYRKSVATSSVEECTCYDGLKILYESNFDHVENAFERYQDTDIQSEAAGCSMLETHLGLGVNYLDPAGIAGVEICVWGSDKIFQKKMFNPKTGRKEYVKPFDYPIAVGLFSIGFEKSLTNTPYYAFKVDPVYFNTIIALHPAQFLYSKNNDQSTFTWRPEIGLCFAGLSVDYAFNLPFKSDFTSVQRHQVSVRLMIRTIKIDR